MGKARRVGGSGWAGLHGSFIGLSKGKPSSKGGMRLGKPKKKPAPPPKIDLKALPENLDVQRAAKRVQAVQADIEATKKRLHTLESQHAMLMEALNVAIDLAKPVKALKRPKDKAGQPKLNLKKAKQSSTERLAGKKAREKYRKDPEEVEVEQRAGGVLIGKRIVQRP